MDTNGRDDRAESRRSKRRKQVWVGRIVIIIMVIILAVLCGMLVKGYMDKKGNGSNKTPAGDTQSESAAQSETQAAVQTEGSKETLAGEGDIIAQADKLAAMYDYDGAMELLKNTSGYESDTKMQSKVSEYQATKDTCVEYPLEEVTHVFYHTLVVDPQRAFAVDDHNSRGINQMMTTIDEFNKITQSMYDKGYVMVSLKDMGEFDENGSLVKGKILLPPGKKPFVLSQDDVSYYHYMDGYGMGTKLLIDENGEVKCEYIEKDGSVEIGNYDMVPLVDQFVKEHPDFSYRGAKGTIALTGYNGVLGYHTDVVYKTRDQDLDPDQQVWLDANPDFNYDDDVAEATKVADAMKAAGWTFASHTWGHQNVQVKSLDQIKTDNTKWQEYVKPIIGDTNIIIFAFGADIGTEAPYTDENTSGKFTYLKEQGFDIFCNVDSSQYWVQLGENFMRQGRRNLDGYRMYYNKDKDLLGDLFDVDSVFDKARPTPVPEMGSK